MINTSTGVDPAGCVLSIGHHLIIIRLYIKLPDPKFVFVSAGL